jgi:RecB family endonuclease NucS
MIPVKLGQDIKLNDSEFEEYNFKDLNIKENSIEEFLRKHIEVIFNDEETLLIVGQQVNNVEKGRSDLVAIDQEGNIVLIEIKRDKDDIVNRKEPFEFQAIRYAASFAKIKNINELVSKIYASYISKYRSEYDFNELTEIEYGIRAIENFLKQNNSYNSFNKKQRILLIASEFDPQTLSAVAWLISNNVDISCFQIKPIKFNNDYFIDLKKILPPVVIDDFYVDIQEKSINKSNYEKLDKEIKRNYKPRIQKMFEWGLLKKGDQLKIKNVDDSIATIEDPNYVIYKDEKLTYNDWGEKVTKWSAINIYEWAVKVDDNKTLEEIRMKKIEELELVEK